MAEQDIGWREAVNKVLVAHGIRPTDVLERGLEITPTKLTYKEIARGEDGRYLFDGDQVKTSSRTFKLTKTDKETLGYE